MTWCAQRLDLFHRLEGFNWSHIKTVWSSNIDLDKYFAVLHFIIFYSDFYYSQFLNTLNKTRRLIFTRRVTILNFWEESASHHSDAISSEGVCKALSSSSYLNFTAANPSAQPACTKHLQAAGALPPAAADAAPRCCQLVLLSSLCNSFSFRKPATWYSTHAANSPLAVRASPYKTV